MSLLPVTRRDVDLCQFDQWHPHFAAHAFASSVSLVAPSEFVAWLRADDGVHLADDNDVVRRATHIDEAIEYDDDGWQTELAAPLEHDALPACAEFRAQLQSALARLGGVCFVKLNWSAPRDASWLLGAHGADLKFTCVDEILLALKGSDFIAHDLEHRYEHCVDAAAVDAAPPRVTVVLKPWKALRRAGEFRCFVYRRRLIGVSQRHADSCFRHLVDEKAAILGALTAFFATHVAPQTAYALESFVCDVYVTSARAVRILDIAPLGVMTDSVLFTAEELAALCGADAPPELRIVESQHGIRPSLKSVAGLPYDLTLGAVDACANVDALVDQLRALQSNNN
jgi:hypothetical protein